VPDARSVARDEMVRQGTGVERSIDPSEPALLPCGRPDTGPGSKHRSRSPLRPSIAPPRHAAPAGPTVLVLALIVAVVLAGCSSLGIGGPRRTLTPASTPTPAAATVEPTLAPHQVAIAAFVEKVTSGDLTYRVVFEGSARGSADFVPVKGVLVVAGADFANEFTYDFSVEYRGLLGEYDVAQRAVDGKGWIKRPGKDWAVMKSYGIDDSSVPFKAVASTADVKYLGETTTGGETRYKLGIPGSLLLHPNTIPYQIKQERIDSTTLEVVIDGEGVPRSGTWNLRAQARVGSGVGQLQRIEYDLELAFAKVGADLSVSKP
jgi:uncharacterized protein YceK